MKKNIKNIDEEVEIYHRKIKNSNANILNRFRWIREKEREVDFEKLNIVPIVRALYIEGRDCFSFGFYFASIQTIGTSIEVFYKQVFRLRYRNQLPDLFYGKKGRFDLDKAIKTACSLNVISKKLSDRINEFRLNIRNLATHQEVLIPLPLGWEEIKLGEYYSENGEDPLTPEEAAKEGLICALKLFKEYSI